MERTPDTASKTSPIIKGPAKSDDNPPKADDSHKGRKDGSVGEMDKQGEAEDSSKVDRSRKREISQSQSERERCRVKSSGGGSENAGNAGNPVQNPSEGQK